MSIQPWMTSRIPTLTVQKRALLVPGQKGRHRTPGRRLAHRRQQLGSDEAIRQVGDWLGCTGSSHKAARAIAISHQGFAAARRRGNIRVDSSRCIKRRHPVHGRVVARTNGSDSGQAGDGTLPGIRRGAARPGASPRTPSPPPARSARSACAPVTRGNPGTRSRRPRPTAGLGATLSGTTPRALSSDTTPSAHGDRSSNGPRNGGAEVCRAMFQNADAKRGRLLSIMPPVRVRRESPSNQSIRSPRLTRR